MLVAAAVSVVAAAAPAPAAVAAGTGMAVAVVHELPNSSVNANCSRNTVEVQGQRAHGRAFRGAHDAGRST